MQLIVGLPVTSLYAALLAFFFVAITIRVARYRGKTGIHLGNGDNEILLRLNRGQQNFTETVPLALLLIALMELAGASSVWLHTLGTMLAVGRFLHYLQLTQTLKHLAFRGTGMLATLLVYPISAIWLLLNVVI